METATIELAIFKLCIENVCLLLHSSYRSILCKHFNLKLNQGGWALTRYVDAYQVMNRCNGCALLSVCYAL